MAVYTLIKEQKIPASVAEVWDFISSPKNLKKITPDYMGFDILTNDLPEKIYPGIIIAYDVKPFLNVKMRWVTEITNVKELEYFVDEQRSGPYKLWHHQHHIKPIEGGVLMTDIVHYQPPFGIIGSIVNHLIIKRQLKEIFEFRTKKLEELFGKI